MTMYQLLSYSLISILFFALAVWFTVGINVGGTKEVRKINAVVIALLILTAALAIAWTDEMLNFSQFHIGRFALTAFFVMLLYTEISSLGTAIYKGTHRKLKVYNK